MTTLSYSVSFDKTRFKVAAAGGQIYTLQKINIILFKMLHMLSDMIIVITVKISADIYMTHFKMVLRCYIYYLIVKIDNKQITKFVENILMANFSFALNQYSVVCPVCWEIIFCALWENQMYRVHFVQPEVPNEFDLAEPETVWRKWKRGL